jgi:hypothetical protein
MPLEAGFFEMSFWRLMGLPSPDGSLSKITNMTDGESYKNMASAEACDESFSLFMLEELPVRNSPRDARLC